MSRRRGRGRTLHFRWRGGGVSAPTVRCLVGLQMFSVVHLAWKGWCIARGGGGGRGGQQHVASVAVQCSAVLVHRTFLAGDQQLSGGVLLPVLVERQLLSWRRRRWKVAGLSLRLVLD